MVASVSGARLANAAEKPIIGIVYVGPRDDFGWNQAHAVAAKALKAVPGVTVVEDENVPETDACAKTMESMIKLDGANIILGTSFGYFDPFMIDLSKKYAKVQFRHAAPLWTPKLPINLGSYFGYLNQAHYVDGVAAGLSTKSNKLGFVAAKPIASVLSNINSFLLGARSTNPKATVQVIFTGDWSLPVREAEATNALVDAGNDVITCHVDSPKVVITTAEKRGVKTCGHNASQAPLAPKGFITGAEYKWITVYKGYATELSAGKPLPNMWAAATKRPGAEHAVRRGRRRLRRARPQPPRSPPQKGQADLCRSAEGQQGQVGHQQDLRQSRSLAEQHELSARRRPRLDYLIAIG